jgi:hypothetical protein
VQAEDSSSKTIPNLSDVTSINLPNVVSPAEEIICQEDGMLGEDGSDRVIVDELVEIEDQNDELSEDFYLDEELEMPAFGNPPLDDMVAALHKFNGSIEKIKQTINAAKDRIVKNKFLKNKLRERVRDKK